LIYGANYTIAHEVMNGYLEPLGFIVLRAASAMILFWGIYIFLQSIMAMIVALLAGRDTLSVTKIFVAVLIFCGVYSGE